MAASIAANWAFRRSCLELQAGGHGGHLRLDVAGLLAGLRGALVDEAADLGQRVEQRGELARDARRRVGQERLDVEPVALERAGEHGLVEDELAVQRVGRARAAGRLAGRDAEVAQALDVARAAGNGVGDQVAQLR